ncbi:MAG: outer membrane lipoprotein-sorting protein [Bdellovibrionia bacterium]
MNLLKLFTAVLIFAPAVQAGDPAPQKILEQSDRARGGLAGGLSWTIHIKAVQDGAPTESEYEVKAKGNDVLAKCTQPARQKGEVFLFNNRNLWIHRPGLKKPVSISTRQRLTGQAANGDIATTNYARDYTAKLEGTETVGGLPSYKLMLKAKTKDVTYDGIRYWVSKDKLLAMRAEFLTLDGKVFKKAGFEYDNSVTSGGKSQPFVSRMTIIDAAFASNTTTIEYKQPMPADLKASVFNVNNISR